MDRIRLAADELVAAALGAQGWEEALGRFSTAAGAHGAVLMNNRPDRLVAAVTTPDVAEAVADFAAGKAPPSSRYALVRYGPKARFRIDHDDYSDELLARDPFYQEFLRPIGYFWHANVALTSRQGETVELSLKRLLKAGSYDRADAALLDAALPELRAAARIAKGTLDAETRGMVRLMRARGRPVFEIDARGRVLAGRTEAEADPACPVRVLGRRLAAADPAAQAALDRALDAVISAHARSALAPVPGANGRRYFLQFVSVPGSARDVFLSAAALAVLIDVESDRAGIGLDAGAIRSAFLLTEREADVASRLGKGLDLVTIARQLGVSNDTVRTYLKSVFEKTGTHRQAELVALLARLHM